jgi:hypothetical protein
MSPLLPIFPSKRLLLSRISPLLLIRATKELLLFLTVPSASIRAITDWLLFLIVCAGHTTAHTNSTIISIIFLFISVPPLLSLTFFPFLNLINQGDEGNYNTNHPHN